MHAIKRATISSGNRAGGALGHYKALAVPVLSALPKALPSWTQEPFERLVPIQPSPGTGFNEGCFEQGWEETNYLLLYFYEH